MQKFLNKYLPLALAVILIVSSVGFGVFNYEVQTVHATGITFDAASDSGGAGSWSHTTSGTNRYLVVYIVGNSTDNISVVTYNGVSMTRLIGHAPTNADRWTYLYGLANPALGTNTVSVTGSINFNLAVSYDGVAQTGQPDATGYTTGLFWPVTLTFSTVANNSWVVYGIYPEDASTVSASTGTFLRHVYSQDARINMLDTNGPVTPAGSYSGTITGTGTAAAEVVGASLAPFVATTSPIHMTGTMKAKAKVVGKENYS